MDIQRKILIDVRLAGWSCLLPASVMLVYYQWTRDVFFLIMIGLIAIYAAFVQATATSEKWHRPNYVLQMAWVALFFIGVVPAIPLFFAYHSERKAGWK